MAALPVPHRLVIIYLMLPVGVFLVGWLHWWLGIPATALVVVGLWKTLGGSWRLPSPRPMTFVLLLVAFGWVMATAAGGIFDSDNGDWIKHRSIFTDLARHPWPVWLPDPLTAFLAPETTGANALLRYYLGYYSVPGLVGSWFGPAALSWAVPLWTWMGLALLVLLFTRRFAGNRETIVAMAVLVAFSGMDALSVGLGFGDISLFSSTHLEAGNFLFDNYRVQYPSNMSAMVWAPQHFITSGLYTMLLLQLRKEPRFLTSIGIVLAACLFWSPFVAIGLLPLLAVLLLDNDWRRFLCWQNFLGAALAALLAAYLTSDTSTIVHGWLWQTDDWSKLIWRLSLFYLTEFLVLSCLLWYWQPQIRRERFFIVSVATLLVLPLCSYGYFNDLSLRVSMPALMILCWYFAGAIANGLPINSRGRKGRARGAKSRKRPGARRAKQASANVDGPAPWRRVIFGLMVAILLVGSMTPLHELIRAFADANVFRYEQQLYSVSTNINRPIWIQYLAGDLPAAVNGLLRTSEKTANVTKPWQLVSRSHFDIYVNGNILLYTRTPCTEEDMKQPFFVHIWPKHSRDLPAARQRHGFNGSLYDLLTYALWKGQQCAAIRKLPEYPIKRVVTGQFESESGKRLWQARIPFRPPTSSAPQP